MADTVREIPWGPGDEIRLARKQSGISQAELALAVGVSRDTIGEWERGNTEPSISQWRMIASVTNQPWILGPPVHLISVSGKSPGLVTTDAGGIYTISLRQLRLDLRLPPPTVTPTLTVIATRTGRDAGGRENG